MERILVGALVVQRNGGLRILLGRRSADRAFYPDVWDMFGGHCESRETAEQALIRELQEELGITPTAWRPLGKFGVPVQGDATPMTLHVYEVTAWTGTPHNCQPEEHAEVAWFTIDDACQLRLAHHAYPVLFRSLVAGVERELPRDTDREIYPLAAIGQAAIDMGVADLSARHNWYAHNGPEVERDKA